MFFRTTNKALCTVKVPQFFDDSNMSTATNSCVEHSRQNCRADKANGRARYWGGAKRERACQPAKCSRQRRAIRANLVSVVAQAIRAVKITFFGNITATSFGINQKRPQRYASHCSISTETNGRFADCRHCSRTAGQPDCRRYNDHSCDRTGLDCFKGHMGIEF